MLYTNNDTQFRYRYAREYGIYVEQTTQTPTTALYTLLGNNNDHLAADDNYSGDDGAFESRLVSRNGNTHTVRAVLVPDGVSLDANMTTIKGSGRMSRLYLYSDAQLDEEELATIERGVMAAKGRRFAIYPSLRPEKPVATLDSGSWPRNNFYVPAIGDVTSASSRLIEYRYFLARHRQANIAFEPTTGRVYRLAPIYPTSIVLIMPRNFVPTRARGGYFAERTTNGEFGLIAHLYSRHALSFERARSDDVSADELVSVLSDAASEERVLSHARSLLARLGMHRVIVNRDTDRDVAQIYGYDRYATVVIGRVDNLQLPDTVLHR